MTSPIKWKTTRVGEARVIHWKKHDAKELMKAIDGAPIQEIGKHPVVRVHDFGKLRLAVREFDPFAETNVTGKQAFARLNELARKHAAIVEAPVAFVHRGKQNPLIVTIWKKNHTKLIDYLSREDILDLLKERACITAAIQTAKLHATGIIHGHLDPENFVVSDGGHSQLIDCTLLRKFNPKNDEVGLKDFEAKNVFERISLARYGDHIADWKRTQRADLRSRMYGVYLTKKGEILEKMKRNNLHFAEV